MISEPYVWRELRWQRPFSLDAVCEALSHMAVLTSRGFVVLEARCRNGRMRYLIGTGPKSVNRVQEVFRAHGGGVLYRIRLVGTRVCARCPKAENLPADIIP